MRGWLVPLLLRASRRLMPAHRRDWVAAMHAESAHLPDGAATRWAFGCLIAAMKARFFPMHTGTFRVSRWIMLVETLGCFGPALLAWIEFAFGASGVVRLDGAVIDRYFLPTPGGSYVLALMIGFSVTGLIAPIGAFLGLRYVLSGRALANHRFGWALIAAPAIQSIAGVVGFLWMGTGGWGTGMTLFVLCTLLPIVGVLHLMYLARPTTPMATARFATG